MNHKIKKLLYFDSVFSGARMLTGSTAILYLMSRGLSIADIAFLKLLQHLVILLMDIPSSYIADRYSKRFIIFVSVLCGSIWMVFTAYSPSIWWLFVAEMFNGFSLALYSGSFESLAINTAISEGLKDPFIIINWVTKYSFFFMALAAFFGGLFVKTQSSVFWWIGGILLFTLAVLAFYILPGDILQCTHNENYKKSTGLSIKKDFHYITSLFNNINLMLIIAIGIVVSLSYQVLIQYWQVLTYIPLEKNLVGKQGFVYSIIFVIILLVQHFAGKISYEYHIKHLILALLLVSILLLIGNIWNTPLIIVIPIVAFFFFYRLSMVYLSKQTHREIDNKLRATVISISNTALRILLVVFFLLIGVAIHYIGLNVVPIFILLFLLLCFLLSVGISSKIKLLQNRNK
ncbi:MAG: MFS transporter [Deltaproteobacteria bacterium]|nr:MFS transporter [Deltaproteobacteria bacterium]